MILYDLPYIKMPILQDDIANWVKMLLLNNKKESTLIHVCEVAKTNMQIAEQYGLDRNKCYWCGMLHDISTVIKPDDMLKVASNSDIVLDEAERRYPFLLHQQISKIIAKDVLQITDDDILSAIECHTTLRENPSKYDMSLFITDKLSWDQNGIPPYSEAVKSSLSNSLEAACYEYIKYVYDHDLILYPHKWLTQAKEYLQKVVN